MPSDLHLKLQRKGQRYLFNNSYWITEQEVSGACGIVDVWGLSFALDYTCSAIEVKVSRNDFRSASQQYKNNNADSIANLCYILCPKEMIKIEEVHNNWGLLWYNEKTDRIINKKKPKFVDMDDRKKLISLSNFLWSGANCPKKIIKV